MANSVEDLIKDLDKQIDQLSKARGALQGVLRSGGSAAKPVVVRRAARKRVVEPQTTQKLPVKRSRRTRAQMAALRAATASPVVNIEAPTQQTLEELKRKADEEAGIIT